MLDIQHERSLVKECKKGNQKAFEELEADCRTKIRSSIFKLVKDEHSVEDIYQQGLSKSWAKIKNFKGDSRFSTWLCRICFNLAYDKFRKESREPTTSLEALKAKNPDAIENLIQEKGSLGESGLKKVEALELMQKLTKTLSGLKPKHKEVLELHAKEDLSYKEISQKIDIPVGTVMSRLYYAKKKARSLYKTLTKNEK